MKKHKKLIIGIVVVLLAAAWIWRYVSMNKYYDDLDNGEYKLYSLGEVVPFEDDTLGSGASLDGCCIQANGIEIRDCDELLAERNLTLPASYQKPEKIALVTVTIQNDSNEDKMFELVYLSLRGVDFTTPTNSELIRGLNPQLGRSNALTLVPGEDCTLTLAYDLYRDRFGGITWHRLDKCKFYLQVTSTMTQKEILVNG